MSVKCPACGLFCPDSATRCDCGQALAPEVAIVAHQPRSAQGLQAATLLLLAGVFALLLFSVVTHMRAPRWEYMIESVPDAGFQKSMDTLGNQGWEMVFARRASSDVAGKAEFSYEVIFKRPL
jgi:hypothetical protein